MYVCLCHGVTERTIRDARERGIRCVEQLGAETGCGTSCGCCISMAADLLGDSQCSALGDIFASTAVAA